MRNLHAPLWFQCADADLCALPKDRLAVPPQVILVLGNTGSGKTTLSRHLARLDADMQAVEEDSRILIRGDHIDSSVHSVTKVSQVTRT